jgi:hypothetical protein
LFETGKITIAGLIAAGEAYAEVTTQQTMQYSTNAFEQSVRCQSFAYALLQQAHMPAHFFT